MKRVFQLIAVVMTFGLMAAYAHHPTIDINDGEIYERIDEMISDTPHADMTFDDMGGEDGMTEIVIDTRSVREVESLVDDGLLTEASLLDGEVTVEIVFEENGGVQTTITQEE